jgi:hypothetical protein
MKCLFGFNLMALTDRTTFVWRLRSCCTDIDMKLALLLSNIACGIEFVKH